MATLTRKTLSVVLPALVLVSAQAAFGQDAFFGTLTVTGNQADTNAVIPGSDVRLTVADNPQSYNAAFPGISITRCQLNWSVPSGGIDLTTGAPWTWDNSLLAGFTMPPEGQEDYVTAAMERVLCRRAWQMLVVPPMVTPIPVGIQATSFTLGTLTFKAPSYGASNTYTISLAGGSDAEGTSTVLGDADYYIYQGNGKLTLPSNYTFTVIPGGAWRATSTNQWHVGANWSGGGAPDATYTALFDDATPPVATAPLLYKDESILRLRLERAGAGVSIGTSGGAWRLSVGSGGINSVGTGTNTINAGLNVAATSTWNVGAGNILAAAGGLDIGGNTLTKDGPGSLIMAGPQTHTAGSKLAVNAGTVKFDGTQRLGTLNVNNGTVQLTQDADKIIVLSDGLADNSVPALTIDPAAGKLDLTNNDLIIKYSGGVARQPTALLNSVKDMIKRGYNARQWNGNGIMSSKITGVAKNTYGIGYAQNDMVRPTYSSFSGEDLTDPDPNKNKKAILVKYTYLGDLNLDGQVDDMDVGILGLYYDGGVATNRYWNQGDIFGYDGKVDGSDVSVFNLTYGLGVGHPLGGDVVSLDFEGLNLAATMTPEPATMALMAVGLAAIVARRRRRA
jgi:hypothetical protein